MRPLAHALRKRLSLAAVCLTLATVAAGCSGSNSAGSQDAGSSAGAPGAAAAGRHRMAQALASLDLSDDQKTQIRAIMKSVRAQNATVSDPAQKRANFRAGLQRVEGVLTPAQRTKLQAEMAQMRAQQGTSAR